ncbi:phosphatase PAP2 family protein [Streptomyces sp. 11x1]|uniref:phosphatase PAP2 family protein n=1 Tax=Streptomyces sp. 11x1 TaxID=3038642 RepID=UPI00292F2604|nr:phosphatase PAP2 family protein [Streptomyces sp. 11x1]WNZ09912.1 phosphatase PAP2 family protein [Streptomyces sp. 11x1]
MNRLLLAVYPEPYRSRQGEEVLACLSEAYPGRSWPPPREVAALVRAGVRARARAVVDDTARPWWLDGIHLAALRSRCRGSEEAWIYPLSGAVYGSTPLPPMELSAKPTLMVGLAVIVVLTLVRRCWWQGCAALGVVIFTTGGKEVLESTILPRPDLVGAPENLLEQGFPSGHTAIPAALTLAAVLVVSPRIRPYVATAGVLWLACIAAASATMGGHRPSEVLGATLLACACYGLATWLLLPAAVPGATWSPRALPAITLTLALAVALASGARNDTLTRSLTSAAAGFLCAALVWYAAVGRPARAARRTRPALG